MCLVYNHHTLSLLGSFDDNLNQSNFNQNIERNLLGVSIDSTIVSGQLS